MCHPRVLIVNSQSLSENSATGITLRSLWSSWPKECVMEVCLDEAECAGTSALTSASLTPAHAFIKTLAQNRVGKRLNTHMKQDFAPDRETGVYRKQWKQAVRQFAVTVVITAGVRLSRDQLNRIKEFEPQILYTLGGSVTILKLAYALSVQFDIPILLHYMDNWPEHIQWEDNKLLRWYGTLLREWNKKCLKRARNAIVISASMKAKYECSFGCACSVLMNAVDIEKYRCRTKVRSKQIRFVYAGGLHLNRWKALLEIAEILKKVSDDAMLCIYTNAEGLQYRTHFSGLPVDFHPAISHEEIHAVYENADVLVHCETDNKQLMNYFRYSISTKIPEYLATGRPILFYGPRDMGLYHYLDENNAAYVAYDLESLQKALGDCIQSRRLSQILQRAAELAEKNHTAENAQKVLLETVQQGCMMKKGFCTE